MYVTGPGNYDLRVHDAGTDGLQVESADGLDIHAPGNDICATTRSETMMRGR